MQLHVLFEVGIARRGIVIYQIIVACRSIGRVAAVERKRRNPGAKARIISAAGVVGEQYAESLSVPLHRIHVSVLSERHERELYSLTRSQAIYGKSNLRIRQIE